MIELLYLGHIISAEGVRMDPEKVRAIVDWPTPENLTQLRGFLGLCGFYYKKFSGYSCHAAPMTDFLKKGAFFWTPEAQAFFERFKEIMTTCAVLAFPNFSKPFELQCDASGEGIGFVLM